MATGVQSSASTQQPWLPATGCLCGTRLALTPCRLVIGGRSEGLIFSYGQSDWYSFGRRTLGSGLSRLQICVYLTSAWETLAKESGICGRSGERRLFSPAASNAGGFRRGTRGQSPAPHHPTTIRHRPAPGSADGGPCPGHRTASADPGDL